MPRTLPFPNLTDTMLDDLRKRASTKREFQRVQCLSLRQHGCSSQDIAVVMSMSPVNVRRVWSDFRRRGENAIFVDRRGGRYNENMTEQEENIFLESFLKHGKNEGIIVANEIRRAYEQKLRRPVPKSTVYKMLHRHGWRKLAPRPTHPQGDAKAREKFRAIFPPYRTTRCT